MYTTLNLILAAKPCGQELGSTTGWQKLLAGLNKTGPDDEPLSLIRILDINGLNDASAIQSSTPGNASASAARAASTCGWYLAG